MTNFFNDHFALVADNYAQFRPRYPTALFAWLASISPQRELVWDCAAGSGQASIGLADHFPHVIATDASAAQIANAVIHPHIDYRVAPAEASGLADTSVDLVTVAQAMHWFDLDKFFHEVRRVLKPGGHLAVWTYSLFTIEGNDINSLVRDFYQHTVGPYWPAERIHVEHGYRDLPFPFVEISPPHFTMTTRWTLSQLLGYLRSWSATGRYFKQHGVDPVITLATQLSPLWSENSQRRIEWPLALRVGY